MPGTSNITDHHQQDEAKFENMEKQEGIDDR
jgi:hypothetical protein